MLNEFQKKLVQVAQNVALAMNVRQAKGQNVIGEMPFWYTHTPETINATLTRRVAINIQSDADFDAYYLSFVCFETAGFTNVTAPAITWNITDQSTGRQFFSSPAFVSGSAGTGGTPLVLQNVRQFVKKSIINIDFNNVAPAVNYQIQAQIGGVKLFS